MKIEWEGDICIVCRNSTELSVEHIIPRSLGGILTCNFICRQCNSEFGSGFESRARLAPLLRKAATIHRKSIPDIFERIELGADYRSDFDGEVVVSKLRPSGDFGVSETENSIFVPEELTEQILRGKLRRRGHSEFEASAAIDVWKSALDGEKMELSEGLFVKKHLNHPSQPTYQESELNPLNPLKIAYYFAALLVGRAIQNENPTFNVVRDILIRQDAKSASYFVKQGSYDGKKPFHGIAFVSNEPFCTIRICFFGSVVFEVNFEGCALTVKKASYYQDLVTDEECACLH